jgi:hypothetical protein
MRKALVLLFGILLSMAAYAGDAKLTWVNPTQYTDGTTIPAGSLSGNRVEWGTCSGTAFGIVAGSQTLPVSTTYTVTGLTAGTWCFRAYASAGGVESGPSVVASKVIAPPQPQPPSGLTVSTPVVYTIVKKVDGFVLLPVGTVPADTPCDVTQQVNGYFVVPRAKVIWSGTVKPDVVVASCA